MQLPAPLPAFGEYVPAVRVGALLSVAGHFGVHDDGTIWIGKVGADVDLEEARAAARSAARNLLATVEAELGSLEDVAQILRVYGVINATSEFTEHARVIDAASEVLVEALGGRGRHARLAVGVSSLPAGLVLEVDALIAVRA